MRYAISSIVGTGTSEDPYRAKAADYGGHISIIPGNDDGTPKFAWCLVASPTPDEIIAGRPTMSQEEQDALRADMAAKLALAEADPDVTVFPPLTLDDTITLSQRNWLRTRLQNRGLPYLWVNTGDTVRSIVVTIGRYLDEKYDLDWQRFG